METITSRKNKTVSEYKLLLGDREYRRSAGLYVCDGEKLLRDAIASGAELTSIITAAELPGDIIIPQDGEARNIAIYSVPPELLNYVSALKNTRGPIFTVKIPCYAPDNERISNTDNKRISNTDNNRVMILEKIQDPGNVGAIIRGANALNINHVILVGDCADPYGPKTVRAAMGALFRQSLSLMTLSELRKFLYDTGLTLYGAALTENAMDIRAVSLKNCAVAIGSEGGGLSAELLELCDAEIIIPMKPGSESLNAANAASIIMWEMTK